MSDYDWPTGYEWDSCSYSQKIERTTELLREAAANEHPRTSGNTPSLAVRTALHLVERAIEEGPVGVPRPCLASRDTEGGQ